MSDTHSTRHRQTVSDYPSDPVGQDGPVEESGVELTSSGADDVREIIEAGLHNHLLVDQRIKFRRRVRPRTRLGETRYRGTLRDGGGAQVLAAQRRPRAGTGTRGQHSKAAWIRYMCAFVTQHALQEGTGAPVLIARLALDLELRLDCSKLGLALRQLELARLKLRRHAPRRLARLGYGHTSGSSVTSRYQYGNGSQSGE